MIGGARPAHGAAAVDHAHGRGPFMGGEPLGHRLARGRERAAFGQPQHQTAHKQYEDACGQTLTGAGQRPPDDNQGKAPPRPQGIYQPSAAHVHQGIGEKEDRLEIPEILVGDGDIFLNGLDGHRQGLPVQVVDGDHRRNDNRDEPARGAEHPHDATTIPGGGLSGIRPGQFPASKGTVPFSLTRRLGQSPAIRPHGLSGGRNYHPFRNRVQERARGGNFLR